MENGFSCFGSDYVDVMRSSETSGACIHSAAGLMTSHQSVLQREASGSDMQRRRVFKIKMIPSQFNSQKRRFWKNKTAMIIEKSR